MRLARVAALIAFAASLGGCKFGFGTSSSVKEGEENSSVGSASTTIHGLAVPAKKLDEVLLAINDKGASSTPSDSLNPNSNTVLALTGYSLAGGTPYMQTCAAAGVPIPPPWIDPLTGAINTLWKKVASLPSSRIFALDPALETTLYEFVDANGTCAALPRGPAGQHATAVDALGMICQGKTGSACFWDNRTREASQGKITRIADIRPELMADGDSLSENCSNCHRGDNIFIIHEDTDMTKLQNRFPKDGKRAEPISKQGWKNPASAKTFGASCQDGACHNTLAELNDDYCGTVMLPSLDTTMPPAGSDPADYATAIKEIREECAFLRKEAEAKAAAANGVGGSGGSVLDPFN